MQRRSLFPHLSRRPVEVSERAPHFLHGIARMLRGYLKVSGKDHRTFTRSAPLWGRPDDVHRS